MKELGFVAGAHYGTTAPNTPVSIWVKTNNDDPNTWVVQDILFYKNGGFVSVFEYFFIVKEGATGNPPDQGYIWKEVDGLGNFVKFQVYDDTAAAWIPFLADKLDATAAAADANMLFGMDENDFQNYIINLVTNDGFNGTQFADIKELISFAEQNADDITDLQDEVDILFGQGETLDINTDTVLTAIHNKLFINVTSANQVRFTIPSHTEEALPIGYKVVIQRNGAGPLLITARFDVKLNGVLGDSNSSTTQYGGLLLHKIANNEWVLSGN